MTWRILSVIQRDKTILQGSEALFLEVLSDTYTLYCYHITFLSNTVVRSNLFRNYWIGAGLMKIAWIMFQQNCASVYSVKISVTIKEKAFCLGSMPPQCMNATAFAPSVFSCHWSIGFMIYKQTKLRDKGEKCFKEAVNFYLPPTYLLQSQLF